MAGLVIGFVRMVMEFAYGTPSCGEEDLRPPILKDVHYLYFALILLALTALVITVVSLCTTAIPEQHVKHTLLHIHTSTHTLLVFCLLIATLPLEQRGLWALHKGLRVVA